MFELNALFVDLDGTLADFDNGVKQVTGKLPGHLDLKTMWRALAKQKNFYGDLDPLPDAGQLWNFVKPFGPIVLSGLPIGGWAPKQKREWVGKHLGWDVPVVLGWARDKPVDAMKFLKRTNLEGCVLVDDRKKTQPIWEADGGTYILHTSAASSISQLKALGI